MKNVISTITILILILGVGLIIPKMIPAGAALTAHTEQTDVSGLGNDPDTDQASEESGSTSPKGESADKGDPASASDEVKENSGENFPIKTADEDNAFSGKDELSKVDQPSDVDNLGPSVDNPQSPEALQTENDGASSNETKNTEEAKTPSATPEPEVAEITYKTVSYTRWVTAPLNMRRGPGREHAVITSIPMAQSVAVTAIASNGWAKVSYDGREGYVSGRYLSETEVKKPVAAAPKPQETASNPQAASYEAYKMYVGGKAITYKNGGISDGQRIIDSSSKLISTWGGAEVYSGNDGYNTHFIGHNPGIFSVLTQIGKGSTIVVTDKNGHPTTYSVTRIFTVDDHAYNAKDGENYYNYMVSKRGGEVITLQTCLGSNKNLVIRAEK